MTNRTIVAAVAAPSKYLGQVATRCQVSNTFDTQPGTTWGMSRTVHWARENINGLTAIYPAFYLDANNNEANNAGTTTFKCGLEYPLGTNATLNAEGTVSVSGGLATLTFPNAVIPVGALFAMRPLVTNPNVVPYKSFTLSNGCAAGEGYVKGSGTPNDLTVSGAITSIGGFNNSRAFYPVALLSQTRRPSVLVLGDSRAFGQGDVPSDISADLGNVPRIIGPQFGYSNMSVPSVKASDFLTHTNTSRLAMASWFSHVICQLGTNDLVASATAAAVAGSRTSIYALFPNNICIGTTLEPIAASTDSWATTANQTGTAVFLTFNNLVRAGITGESFYIDISDTVDPNRANIWSVARNPYATSGTALFSTADGTHATSAISDLMKNRAYTGFMCR